MDIGKNFLLRINYLKQFYLFTYIGDIAMLVLHFLNAQDRVHVIIKNILAIYKNMLQEIV